MSARCMICFLCCLGLAASCGLSDAGSFSLSLTWESPPDGPVWVWLKVEERSDPDVSGKTLGSTGPDEYIYGEPFLASVGEVSNGDNRYVVIEVREGPSAGLPVLYYGISEPFSIEPGKHTEVAVPLVLNRPETEMYEPTVTLLFDGVPAEAAGLASVSNVTIRTRSFSAVALQLANDASFSANLTSVALGEGGDAECTVENEDGVAWDICLYSGWDLTAGYETVVDGTYSLYLKFVDKRGYESRVYKESVLLDSTPPVAIVSALSPAFAHGGETVALTVTFHEALAEVQGAALAVQPSVDGGPQFEGPERVGISNSYVWLAEVPPQEADASEYTFTLAATDAWGNAGQPAPLQDVNGGSLTLVVDVTAPLVPQDYVIEYNNVEFGLFEGEGAQANDLEFDFVLRETHPFAPGDVDGECSDDCPLVLVDGLFLGPVERRIALDDPQKQQYGFHFKADISPAQFGDIDKDLPLVIRWQDVAGNVAELELSQHVHVDFIRPAAVSCTLLPEAANAFDLVSFTVTFSEPVQESPVLQVSVGAEAFAAADPVMSGLGYAYTWQVPASALPAGEVVVSPVFQDLIGNSPELSCEESMLVDNEAPQILATQVYTDPPVVNLAGETLALAGDQYEVHALFMVTDAASLSDGYPRVELAVPGAPVLFPSADPPVLDDDGTAQFHLVLQLDAPTMADMEGYWPVRVAVEDMAGNATMEDALANTLVGLDFTPPHAQCGLVPELPESVPAYGIGSNVNISITAFEEVNQVVNLSFVDTTLVPDGGTFAFYDIDCVSGNSCFASALVEETAGERQFEARVILADLVGNETPDGGTACLDGPLMGAVDGVRPEVVGLELEVPDDDYESGGPLMVGILVLAQVDVKNSDLEPVVLLGSGSMVATQDSPVESSPGVLRWVFERTLDGSEGEGYQTVIVEGTDAAGNAYAPGITVAATTLDFTPPTAFCAVSPELAKGGDTVEVTVTATEPLLMDVPLFVSDIDFAEPGPVPDETQFLYFHLVDPLAPEVPEWTYSVFLTDKAGNMNAGEFACSGSGSIDTTLPTIAGGEAGIVVSHTHIGDDATLTVGFEVESPDDFMDPGPVVKIGNAVMDVKVAGPGMGYEFEYYVSSVGPDPAVEGVWPLSVALADQAGNQRFYSPGTVTFDFTDPHLLGGAAVSLTPPEGCPLAEVTALTGGSTLDVSITVDNVLTSVPALVLEGGALAPTEVPNIDEPNPYRTTFSYRLLDPQGEVLPADTEESVQLTLAMQDMAGNTAQIDLGQLQIDTVVPGTPLTEVADLVRYVRAPWGADTTGGNKAFSIQAEAGAVEPGSRVCAFAQPEPTAMGLVGIAQADDAGAFGGPLGSEEQFLLNATDTPRIYVQAVDAACNRSGASAQHPEGVATLVRDVEWIATMGYKIGGDSMANPHEFDTRGWFAPQRFQEDAVEPEDVAVVGWPEAGHLETRGAPRWRTASFAMSDPGERQWAAAAFDSARERVVLFGGGAGSPLFGNALWEHDGDSWMERAILDPEGDGSPPPRAFPAAVYDAHRNVTVLFGGFGIPDMNYYTELWEWDGASWTRREPQDPEGDGNPEGAYANQMVFDSARNVVLLVSGDMEAGEELRQWEWNGASWVRHLNADACGHGPLTVGNGFALAYDAVRERVVLFGGTKVDTSDADDTWEWDGSSWCRVIPEDPEGDGNPNGRYASQMVYDENRGVAVMYGQAGQGPIDADGTVWEWDGLSWRMIIPPCATAGTCPKQTKQHNMVYVSSTGHTMMYGGNQMSTDTWLWDGQNWESWELSSGGPSLYDHLFVTDPDEGRCLMLLGTGPSFQMDTLYERKNGIFGSISAVPFISAAPAGAYDAAVSALLVFRDECDTEEAFWKYAGGAWSQPAVSDPEGDGNPEPRENATMVYDSLRERTVLFGGRIAGLDMTDELWEWNGDSWALRQPTDPEGDGNPPATAAHTMVYDVHRQISVMFGGEGLAGTWEYDGESWRKPELSDPEGDGDPAPRWEHVMVYSTKRQTTLMTRGNVDDGGAVWEYDGTSWFRHDPAYVAAYGAPLSPLTAAAAAFDPSQQQVVLHGGLMVEDDFAGEGAFVDWTLEWKEDKRPAHAMHTHFAAAKDPQTSVLAVRARFAAAGLGQLQEGSQLMVFDRHSWLAVDENDAPLDEPAELTWSSTDPAQLARLFDSFDMRTSFAVTTAGPNGDGSARLQTSYAEVKVAYYVGNAIGWGFDTPDDGAEGWSLPMGPEPVPEPVDGVWSVPLGQADTLFVSPRIEIEAQEHPTLQVRARLTNAVDDCQLHFRWMAAGEDDWCQSDPAQLWIEADGGWALYSVDLSDHDQWTGTIGRLSISPACQAQGQALELDFIRITN